MFNNHNLLVCLLFFSLKNIANTQSINSIANRVGVLSLGSRTTLSALDGDGTGLGTGGQFRIRLSQSVNSDWFADYIVVNSKEVRSEYYHIVWSVLYYPFKNSIWPDRVVQPFVLARHCFDYNKKMLILDRSVYKDRWGSAIQSGIGTHFNLTDRLDLTMMCQYMIHLTDEIHPDKTNTDPVFSSHRHSSLEGHLLATFSVNYIIASLWKSNYQGFY
jgi:hypothetical protein